MEDSSKSKIRLNKRKSRKKKKVLTDNPLHIRPNLDPRLRGNSSNWEQLAQTIGIKLKKNEPLDILESVLSNGQSRDSEKRCFKRIKYAHLNGSSSENHPSNMVTNSNTNKGGGLSSAKIPSFTQEKKEESLTKSVIDSVSNGKLNKGANEEHRCSANFRFNFTKKDMPASSKCGIENGNHSHSNSNGHTEFEEPKQITKVVAMDCEMVGTGLNGSDSMLARVSIVNSRGECLYDEFVKPKEDITDYRTKVSGVRPSDLINGKDLFEVQHDVSKILEGKILVGHSLKHDFKVLFLSHPSSKIRDTSKYKPFRKLCGGCTPSLKKLTSLVLGAEIQTGEHNSVEDSQAAMQIYLVHKREWEKDLKSRRRVGKVVKSKVESS